MNQPSSQYSNDNDEISLVDLAKILVKRWKAMAIIFSVVVLASLAYALLTPRTYSYTSLYEVAEKAPGEALEAPETLVAKAKRLYLASETRDFFTKVEVTNIPFSITIENLEETLLVSLTSQSTEGNTNSVKRLHEGVLSRLKEGQKSILKQRKESLQRQIQSAENALRAAEESETLSAPEIVASIMNRIAILEAELSELREGVVSQVAEKSLKSPSIGSPLVVLIGVVLGAMLSVVGAFIVNFIALVYMSIKHEIK